MDPREERRWAPPRASPGASPEGTFVDSKGLFEWKLDDMRLVVESQLVLYRNPFKQAMSLKLVDVDERVTMLTCLSAWLDNIFAGVPELAVCYHREGIVKGCAPLVSTAPPSPFDVSDCDARRHCPYFAGTR